MSNKDVSKKVIAKAKWVRSAPRKIMRVVDTVRGKPAAEALTMLSFMPQKGARILAKVIKSAMANAKNNFKMAEESLLISEAYVNKGVDMKRFNPVSRGRAHPILKRGSHVTVALTSREAA
ncbi:MAG TPA: 50S ribosomal protein L22, partial [Candidatus Sulfotelmatobacter sp.]|nr:50S ribosomal protein L22 [Candidatus Sulfotelmatobacter sp.]